MSSKLVFGIFDTNWVVIIFFGAVHWMAAVLKVIVSVTSRGSLLTHLINSWLSTRVFTLITNSWHHDDSDSVVRKRVDYVIRWWMWWWVEKVQNLLTQVHISIEKFKKTASNKTQFVLAILWWWKFYGHNDKCNNDDDDDDGDGGAICESTLLWRR